MEQIGIEGVLAKINITMDDQSSMVRTFGMRFITEKGDKREITFRKWTKTPKQESTGQDKRGKDFYNLQRNGVLLIEDLFSATPKSIKTAMIYAFRDFESDKWLKVFH